MDFLMDANGDKAVVDGDFALVSGIDETVQFLIQSVKFFMTEWFLDETKGLPYYDSIFVKNPDPDVIGSIFKTYIINLPGILAITAFDLEFDSAQRVLTINGSFRSFDGEADFSINVPVPGGV